MTGSHDGRDRYCRRGGSSRLHQTSPVDRHRAQPLHIKAIAFLTDLARHRTLLLTEGASRVPNPCPGLAFILNPFAPGSSELAEWLRGRARHLITLVLSL